MLRFFTSKILMGPKITAARPSLGTPDLDYASCSQRIKF